MTLQNFIARMMIGVLLLTPITMTGCMYDKAYRDYAVAQSAIAQAAGPLVTFHPDGKLASVGNPMTAMAMMNMKEPKDGWTQFFHWLEMATPFGAIWGIVGSLANFNKGNSTNVSGTGNYTGNTTSGGAVFGSPPTTTTTTTTTTSVPVE